MESKYFNRAEYVFGVCHYGQLHSKLVYRSKKDVKEFLRRYHAENSNFYEYFGLPTGCEINQTQLLEFCEVVAKTIRYSKLSDEELKVYRGSNLENIATQAIHVSFSSQYQLLALAQLLGDYLIASSKDKWKWIDYIDKRPMLLFFGFPVIESKPRCHSPIQTIFSAATATTSHTSANFTPHILKVLRNWV
jgi:hypothetical protein